MYNCNEQPTFFLEKAIYTILFRAFCQKDTEEFCRPYA